MKFPMIGGGVFLLSAIAALATVSLSNGNKPAADPAAASTPTPIASTETVVFSVPDMSCEIVCAPTVRKTLAAIPGVEKVETNLDDHTATILFSDEFDETKALAALEGAGYPAKAIPE